MHAALITRVGGSDRGIKRARFIVLRDSNIPGVLIEGGFLTNPQDRVRIATPIYRQLLAQAILQGILSYNRALNRVERQNRSWSNAAKRLSLNRPIRGCPSGIH